LATAFATAYVLLRFPPGQSRFYPRCPFYSAFHLQCPGCGGTRALAALLHGQIGAALHDNLLVTLLLPLALGYGAVCYWRWWNKGELHWPRVPMAAIYSTAVATAFFTVVRNLP
jgi:hypothetical protein